ncbi:unnamed protein product [Paramecium primaurelia]|uniref:Transmembrane protein n=1 Tax=Paramecium primaurelia TaxID=5886 RepID=A0A8S1NYC6_PARPR|nr:unnamed protein product [Paramecium primaurelia]CAD8094687.1 unnamed protein product [Paramecium primaurelia]
MKQIKNSILVGDRDNQQDDHCNLWALLMSKYLRSINIRTRFLVKQIPKIIILKQTYNFQVQVQKGGNQQKKETIQRQHTYANKSQEVIASFYIMGINQFFFNLFLYHFEIMQIIRFIGIEYYQSLKAQQIDPTKYACFISCSLTFLE